MKTDNPLDKHLAMHNRMPEGLRPAVCDVADVLDLAWLTAQSVFEDKATPELAVMVFDRLVSRLQLHWSLNVDPHEQDWNETE